MDWMMWMWMGGLVLVLFVLAALRMKKQKKVQAEHIGLIDSIKVGDKITTHIGIFGKVLSITETTSGKVFLIETGDKRKTEMEIDYRVVAGIDEKTIVTLDEQGQIVEPAKLPEISQPEINDKELSNK